MKRVFSSPQSEKVGLMKGILESAGISCEIRNDAISQAMIGFQFASEIWILRDKDFEEAIALVSGFQQTKTLEDTALDNSSKLKQFKTNLRLWFFISLILFVPPWFVMDIKTAGDNVNHPIQLWLNLFQNSSNVENIASRILSFVLLFGFFSLVIGWIIQCFFTIIQDKVKKGNDDSSNLTSR